MGVGTSRPRSAANQLPGNEADISKRGSFRYKEPGEEGSSDREQEPEVVETQENMEKGMVESKQKDLPEKRPMEEGNPSKSHDTSEVAPVPSTKESVEGGDPVGQGVQGGSGKAQVEVNSEAENDAGDGQPSGGMDGEMEKEARVNDEEEEKEVDKDEKPIEVDNEGNPVSQEESRTITHGVHASHGVPTKEVVDAEPGVPAWPWKTDAKTVAEVVDEVWSEIDDQCRLFKLSKSKTPLALTGWKVVRLFVSSTFHDFQNEREILVKKVLPELKEWCEKRSIHLIECDLRWGVPRDSTTRTVLCTCMEEIDRCHEDTEGEAFFLNMLGERYGWIPSEDDVPEDIARKYDWVGNSSITHMEILHGAYRFCNPNAAYFLREVEGMPEDVRLKFADPTELGRAQIHKLRSKIQSRFPDQAHVYSCQYDPSDTSSVKLIGLEKFGQEVLEFFKFAIDRKYPTHTAELTPEEQENEKQQLYLGHKGQLIFGREREISFLHNFVSGKGDYENKVLGDEWNTSCYAQRGILEKDSEEESEKEAVKDGSEEKSIHPPVAVVAKSGAGKSSLMARFIIEAKQAGLNVFYHMIGCSGDSLSLSKLLARLCRHMAPAEDERLSGLHDKSVKEVIPLFKSLLNTVMEDGKQLLIVIDDLTQLELEDTKWSDWIPAELEGAVYMVFSLVEGSDTMSDINKAVPSMQYLILNHLDYSSRVDIVENYFAQYNKKLDSRQLDLLTRSNGAENALWLALACEELRIFGKFETLTDRIQSLPDTLEGLVCDILGRLTKEDETGLVDKALCLLECSIRGLTEQEMQCLLGDFDSQTPIPMLHWAMVRRTLKPFLRRVSGVCKIECLTFFHHAIGGVVRRHWLSAPGRAEEIHLLMADFYQHWLTEGGVFAAKNTAHHLTKAKQFGRLVKFIREDPKSKCLGSGRSLYLKPARCRTMIPTYGPFHTQLFICHFCSMKRGGFGAHQAWPNGDSCPICAQYVSPIVKRVENLAYRCQRHPLKGPRMPHMKTCMLCNTMIMMNRQEKPVYLCQLCHMGGPPFCCYLNTDS
ncbi:telomerase protein component 1-like [Diadema antillarum]|uniref:telomerase protein component 1-like n=1 Tax=Diadema antillarum TaxID=105358 RepID=UPI003A850CF1